MRMGPRAVGVARGDETEGPQVWRPVLMADDDDQPRAVDVFIEDADEALFLFHHSQERAQRGKRDAAGFCAFVEQRGGAVHKQRTPPRQFFEAGLRHAQSPRVQGDVERSLVLQPLEHRRPHVFERQPGEFGIQIVGRLAQRLRIQLLANIDRLPRELSVISHDHDQYFRRAQRNEINFLEDAVAVAHRQRERDQS